MLQVASVLASPGLRPLALVRLELMWQAVPVRGVLEFVERQLEPQQVLLVSHLGRLNWMLLACQISLIVRFAHLESVFCPHILVMVSSLLPATNLLQDVQVSVPRVSLGSHLLRRTSFARHLRPLCRRLVCRRMK